MPLSDKCIANDVINAIGKYNMSLSVKPANQKAGFPTVNQKWRPTCVPSAYESMKCFLATEYVMKGSETSLT